MIEYLANGGLETLVEDILTNNAKLIAGIYAILKYFAVTTGAQGKNKILDLIPYKK